MARGIYVGGLTLKSEETKQHSVPTSHCLETCTQIRPPPYHLCNATVWTFYSFRAGHTAPSVLNTYLPPIAGGERVERISREWFGHGNSLTFMAAEMNKLCRAANDDSTAGKGDKLSNQQRINLAWAFLYAQKPYNQDTKALMDFKEMLPYVSI